MTIPQRSASSSRLMLRCRLCVLDLLTLRRTRGPIVVVLIYVRIDTSICSRRRYEGRTYVLYAMSSNRGSALPRLRYREATICLPCLSSMYNTISYHHSVVALTCRPTELLGCSTTVTTELRDCKPYPLTSRPIP